LDLPPTQEFQCQNEGLGWDSHVIILVVPVTGWGGRPKVLLKIGNDITKLEISSFIKVGTIDTCLNHSWNWNVVL